MFIDLWKAFDTIDHRILINKLSALEIENQEHARFENYLHQRTQSVGYQGVLSEPEFITTGVPKGTVLIQENLNGDLDLMGTWLRDNCLFSNTLKMESVVFWTLSEFKITINGCPIKCVVEFRYLGSLFYKCITWKSHIASILSKAGKRVGILRRIRNDLTSYCANIVSYMYPLYGLLLNIVITVWNCCGSGNVKNLEELQTVA